MVHLVLSLGNGASSQSVLMVVALTVNSTSHQAVAAAAATELKKKTTRWNVEYIKEKAGHLYDNFGPYKTLTNQANILDKFSISGDQIKSAKKNLPQLLRSFFPSQKNNSICLLVVRFYCSDISIHFIRQVSKRKAYHEVVGGIDLKSQSANNIWSLIWIYLYGPD